ncbi:SsrA-binding protein SmpB [Jiulongibacter sediminis]|jgi:SsrA-binding protein|uniref:SsrA-binding protein n=1 Tax=Jiulongibacter sediminis TaxID=1605367 RepID=A0A0P7BHY5_9BACT|nr:SsrA-binding protein SmpB [Jiulongibacter sediminis]KPM46642.1 single-stranded DNA-binding protein [Jiulongibacter sediminis]TBX21499.1 single-stranded DNA-binding protein [Jiulongibacter sediminis]
MSNKISKNIEIKNRKASFEYQFIDTYTAGIVLKGTEIKSIRMGKVNISDAYCYFDDGELYIKNLNISAYDYGTHYNHDPLRDRKLLLQKKELKKLEAKLKDVGLTVIPTKIYVNDSGLAKINIALAKGKKLYDKRESIKAKDIERQESRRF